MANDLDFVQTQWTIVGASGGGKCIQHAPRPGETKRDPRAEGFEPLGELGKGWIHGAIKKGMTTRI